MRLAGLGSEQHEQRPKSTEGVTQISNLPYRAVSHTSSLLCVKALCTYLFCTSPILNRPYGRLKICFRNLASAGSISFRRSAVLFQVGGGPEDTAGDQIEVPAIFNRRIIVADRCA